MSDNMINKFCKELENIGGYYTIAENDEDIVNTLFKITDSYSANSIVFGGHPRLKNISDDYMRRKNEKDINVHEINCIGNESMLLREKLSKADIGVSFAFCIIAETGSAVLLSSPYEPMSLSLLPETSVIIANSKRVVPELTDAVQLIQNEMDFKDLSCMTVISGPSRTADIEKVLVTGVHGPKNLHIILLEVNG
jgi:L-lactate dehydrogenase complex protein LldG